MSSPLLRLERRYDPAFKDRHPAGPPPFTCDGCGARGLAGAVTGVLFEPPWRGEALDLCESCAAAGPGELKKRLEAHAGALMNRAGWLQAMVEWADIEVAPELYVIGSDELAC